MTANQMIELMNRRPFEPLTIHLSDGSVLKVGHPYQIATAPNRPTCIVYEEGSDIARYITYRNITQVVTKDPAGA